MMPATCVPWPTPSGVAATAVVAGAGDGSVGVGDALVGVGDGPVGVGDEPVETVVGLVDTVVGLAGTVVGVGLLLKSCVATTRLPPAPSEKSGSARLTPLSTTATPMPLPVRPAFH